MMKKPVAFAENESCAFGDVPSTLSFDASIVELPSAYISMKESTALELMEVVIDCPLCRKMTYSSA